MLWLRWHISVDCDENCWLAPVDEWWQPGIGHGSWSIIMFVVSHSCRPVGRGVSIKPPLGDGHKNGQYGCLWVRVIGEVVDEVVEVCSLGCRADGKCQSPSRIGGEVE